MRHPQQIQGCWHWKHTKIAASHESSQIARGCQYQGLSEAAAQWLLAA